MASISPQLKEEVTAHEQSDSLKDAREICADGTYFPNNLRINVLCMCIMFYLPVSTHLSAFSHGGPTQARNSFAANEETQPSSSKRPSVKAADIIRFCSRSTQSTVNSRRLAGKKTETKFKM